MIIQDILSIEKESKRREIPIIGPEKGAWLLSIIQKYNPQKILELGTANGYSGIILGSEGAELITLEQNPRIMEEASTNFKQHNIHAQIIFGDAGKNIHRIIEKFDLIFLDFAKKEYMEVLEKCIELLNTGGILIADNISKPDCANFKEAVLHHPELDTEIIDIKDGLSFSIKV